MIAIRNVHLLILSAQLLVAVCKKECSSLNNQLFHVTGFVAGGARNVFVTLQVKRPNRSPFGTFRTIPICVTRTCHVKVNNTRTISMRRMSLNPPLYGQWYEFWFNNVEYRNYCYRIVFGCEGYKPEIREISFVDVKFGEFNGRTICEKEIFKYKQTISVTMDKQFVKMFALLAAISFAFRLVECVEMHSIGLGGRCDRDYDCITAYSMCERGVCMCQPSFRAHNGICESPNFCPHAHNKKPTQSSKYCTAEGYNVHNRHTVGNCSSDSFCYRIPDTFAPTGEPLGICCPRVDSSSINMVCPQGRTIKSAKCPDEWSIPADIDVPIDMDSCQSMRTHCVYWEHDKHACCVYPCGSLYNVGGQCYQYAGLGKPCEHDIQCGTYESCTFMEGKIGKTCYCPNKIQDGYLCLPPNGN